MPHTSCVDVGAPFENTDGMSFPSALERSDEASKPSAYDQDIDTSLLIGPKRLSLHSRVA